jgi:mannose-6-phosphate isomerase-like protein (cupin superfamily)
LKKGDFVTIVVTDWHQLINDSSEELKIVEIQYGENCYEEDIERIE